MSDTDRPNTPITRNTDSPPPARPAAASATAGIASAMRPRKDLNEVRIISHSTLVYWWPVWASAFLFALITYFNGTPVLLPNGKTIIINNSAGLGVVFITILMLVVTFTNIKLRGIYSVVLVISIAFLAVLFAWLGWWDTIFNLFPQLSVHMNVGFYLLFGTVLLIIWLLTFYIFDRMTYLVVRPGQMTIQHIIGGGEESFDTRGALFEQRGDDFFRHIVLGLGAGDLVVTTTGARQQTIDLPNVMFAERKVKRVQDLISIKPSDQ